MQTENTLVDTVGEGQREGQTERVILKTYTLPYVK